MEIRATHKYARISALKARDVAREVTGMPVSDALDVIRFTPKKAALLIGKTLKSAIANAEANHDISAENLVVKSATVNDGPALKRWSPAARGAHRRSVNARATSISFSPMRALMRRLRLTGRPEAKSAKKKVAKRSGSSSRRNCRRRESWGNLSVRTGKRRRLKGHSGPREENRIRTSWNRNLHIRPDRRVDRIPGG